MTLFNFRELWHLVTSRCNNFLLPGSSKESCFQFIVDSHHVGFVRPDFLDYLLNYPNVFNLVEKNGNKVVELNSELRNFEERSLALEQVMLDLKDKTNLKALRGWRNEDYGVYIDGRTNCLFRIERASCSLLGLVKYGVHVNGYVKEGDEIKYMWIAQRSVDKPTWPGTLDNIAAGGLAYGMSVLEAVYRECDEEASIPPEYVKRVKPVGSNSYIYESERGVLPQIEYCFDLELPSEFIPKNKDGEVAGFRCCTIAEVQKLICDEKFKPNSAMVVLDFLFRHGFIDPDVVVQYHLLVEQMHIKMPMEF